MKKRSVLCLALILAGYFLLLASILWDTAPDPRPAMLRGAGVFLLTFGIVDTIRMKSEPDYQKRKKIEYRDERNIAIWNRAGAVSGKVLQWGVPAAAWAAVCLWKAPLWIGWASLGLCAAKSLLELLLVLRYQKDM